MPDSQWISFSAVIRKTGSLQVISASGGSHRPGHLTSGRACESGTLLDVSAVQNVSRGLATSDFDAVSFFDDEHIGCLRTHVGMNQVADIRSGEIKANLGIESGKILG